MLRLSELKEELGMNCSKREWIVFAGGEFFIPRVLKHALWDSWALL